MGDRTIVRVYDRASVPEPVWEMLDLAECGIGAYVPEFKSQSEINVRGFEPYGFLCLSPDRTQLLFTGMNMPLSFWEPATHELLAEVRGLGSESIAFSPDGSQAVVSNRHDCEIVDTKTWAHQPQKISSYTPQYTLDGRYVLMQSRGVHPLKIYDAGTWQPVEHLPEIPEDAVRYVPAPKGRFAIIQSAAGAVTLRDVRENREVAKLRDDSEIYQAVFSPDESQVAVSSRSTLRNSREGARIGIWQTDTGKLLHELRPFERGAETNEGVRGLLWSPDGKYLLAGTTASVPYGVTGVNVFNLTSGRTVDS